MKSPQILKSLINTILVVLITLLLLSTFRQSSIRLPQLPLNSLEKVQSANTLSPLPTMDLTHLGAITQYDEITKRPLFNSTRLPNVLKLPEQEKRFKNVELAENEANQIILNAIIITETERIALLQKKANEKVIRVFIGEQFEGWTLEEVNHHSVILEDKDKSVLIELRKPTLEKNNKKSNKQKRVEPSPNAIKEKLEVKSHLLSYS